jgi:hypothetical protein
MVAVLQGLQSFHKSSFYHCAFRGHLLALNLFRPQPDGPYLLLRHSCHAISFVISNRKMPNEGRLYCQRVSERLCPVGRVRFLHSHFQRLT